MFAESRPCIHVFKRQAKRSKFFAPGNLTVLFLLSKGICLLLFLEFEIKFEISFCGLETWSNHGNLCRQC